MNWALDLPLHSDERVVSMHVSRSAHTGSEDQKQGEWCRHNIGSCRKELASIIGQTEQAGGGAEALVDGRDTSRWAGDLGGVARADGG